MATVADRVKETSTTTGTGDMTLAGAPTGFQTFDAVFATSEDIYYTIVNTDGAWEVGQGHLSGSTTLVRDTVLSSSNSGSLVSFAAGTKDVFCSLPAAAVSFPWITNSNVINLNTDGDTVTIGSNIAGGKLFVDGDADEVQLQVQGNSTQSALLAVFESSAGTDQVTIAGNGAAVFNEAGNDADFRVEGSGQANNLFVDASTNRVGVNNGSPARSLDVVGDMGIYAGGGGAPSEIYMRADSGTYVLRGIAGLSGSRNVNLPGLASSATDTLVAESFAQALSNKTLNSPIISDFTNANHDHLDADDGGTLDAAAIATGTIAEARLPSSIRYRQFTQTAGASFNTSTAENSLVATGVGSVTLAANRLVAGTTIYITASGYGQRGSGNLTVRVKLGGSNICITGTAAPSWGANNMFRLEVEITCRTTGGSGTVYGQGVASFGTTNILVAQMQLTATGAVTVNTTGTLAVDATCQFSASLGTNTVTCTNLTIEVAG